MTKKQQRRIGDVSVHDHHDDVDRISDLPEEIIHTIMSSLAKDDIDRLRPVSKTFVSAARSYPIVDLDFYRFTCKNTQISELQAEDISANIESFLNYVVEFLEGNAGNTGYFRLQNLNFVGPISSRLGESDTRIIKLVDFALNNKIRVLSLDGLGKQDGGIFRRCAINSISCTLPPDIFSAERAQHIEILTLRGFLFSPDLQDLVLTCPLWEDLCLSHCRGLNTINLCGSNLKHVVLDRLSGLNKVTIGPGVRLESFSYTGLDSTSAIMDFPDAFGMNRNIRDFNFLHSCKSLKFLEIRNTTVLTEAFFRANASLFNSLETLKIAECQNLRNVNITSRSLKTFELETSNFLGIYIDVSSLESFSFHSGCKHRSINISSCINLKHLDLKGVRVTAITFLGDNEENSHHFPQFNLLETLKLDSCSMLKTVHIRSNNLKSFELRNCDGLEKIDIDALSLELFVFEFRGIWNRCEIKISACKNLKLLRLTGVIVRKDFFVVPFTEKLVFPFLEKLELEACRLEDGIELYRKWLRSLKLVDCISRPEIKIEAPNLDSFMFKSDVNEVSLFYPLLISPPSSLVPKLFVTTPPSDIPDSFHKSFRTFLSSFSGCKTLFLSCTFSEVMIFSEKMRESLDPPLSGVKHVKVQVGEWPRAKIVELLASLLWLVRCPETMSISSMYPAIRAKKPLELKFHYKSMVEDECLEHHLTEVEVENFLSLQEKTDIQNFCSKLIHGERALLGVVLFLFDLLWLNIRLFYFDEYIVYFIIIIIVIIIISKCKTSSCYLTLK